MVGQCQNFYSRENIIFLTFTETFQIETHFEISYLGVLQFGHIKKFQNVFVFFLVFAVRNGNPWLQKSGNGAGQSEQILKFIDFQLFPVFPTAYLHKLTTIPQKTFEFVLVRLFPVAESLCQRWCKIKSRASSTLIEVQLYCGSLDCAVLLQYRCNQLQYCETVWIEYCYDLLENSVGLCCYNIAHHEVAATVPQLEGRLRHFINTLLDSFVLILQIRRVSQVCLTRRRWESLDCS